MRALLCVFLLAAVTGIAGAQASAANSQPWWGIVRGTGPALQPPDGAQTAGVLIRSREALSRFPVLTSHPGHLGCCEWYQRFDWRHDVVLLVVARLPSEFSISALARKGKVLRVTIAQRYPDQPAFSTPLTSWDAVGVPRHVLGIPLPRRVVVTPS